MNLFSRRIFYRIAVIVPVLLAVGCAGVFPLPDAAMLSRDALDAFMLEGRFSLRQDDKNYSGKLSWRHTSDRDELLLSSPFGQGMAEISSSADVAILTTSDGKKYSAPDAQTLTENVLGYRLPLPLLIDWVRGRSAGAAVVERDSYGRPLRLQQEDWRIDYGYDSDEPLAPPSRLFAERLGSFELRLRIDEWTRLLPTTISSPLPLQKNTP